jgi:hypothetical protein
MEIQQFFREYQTIAANSFAGQGSWIPCRGSLSFLMNYRFSGSLAIVLLFGLSVTPIHSAAPAGEKPPLIRFDKNPEKSREPEVPLGGGTIVRVVQGLIPLQENRDYRVSGGSLFITKAYAAELKGRTTLTLHLRDGSSREVIIHAHDTSKTAPGIDFSPPAGTYDSPRRVIVTSHAVDARIRFTTDGSDPTEKSPSIGYTTVHVDRDMTLKARAFTKGKEPGPVFSAFYRITGNGKARPFPRERILDPTPGAGSYEVYVGSAFYMDEMLDRDQWSYVADTADGLYHRFLGVDPLGLEGKKKLGSHFKGGKAILEGGLRGPQHIRQDLEWIDEVKEMGLKPVATFVNGLNTSPQQQPEDMTAHWAERLELNRKAGIQSYTMQAPHRIADEGGWADPRFDRTRRLTLMSDGTSSDAPTYLFTRRPENYRQGVYDLIRWTHQNKKKFLFIVSPNEGADTFLSDTIMTVRLLEDNGASPDFYGVTLYGKRPLHMVPEATLDKSGRRVGTSTLTGVSYYLLKHARADSGELDLWVEAGGGKSFLKNPPLGTPAPPSPALSAASIKSPSGTLDLVITNRSNWVDFIPVLRASSSSASSEAKFMLHGKDITPAVLGEGHTFLRSDRLLPGQSRKVTVSLPASMTGGLTLELLPHPGSRFVRDTITLNP